MSARVSTSWILVNLILACNLEKRHSSFSRIDFILPYLTACHARPPCCFWPSHFSPSHQPRLWRPGIAEYRLQLDEVQGSQTDTSEVKGFGAPCQAISPIMECGRLTTFINIQMRRNEAAREKCVAQLLSGGHVQGKTRTPPWLRWYAAWARSERSRCSAPYFVLVYLGFSKYENPAGM